MINKTQDEIIKAWKNTSSSDPLVSISCITYNHINYIEQCLDGFLEQETDYPFEILIHDDCSTDGTTEIIQKYSTKYPDIIKPMYETENQYQQGKPAGSLIWNIPRAKGKYIALCEGDDYWIDENKLQMQIDFLENNSDYGICYTTVEEYNENKKRFAKEVFGKKIDGFEELILKGNCIPTLSVVLLKSLYLDYLKDIDPIPKKWMMGDYPLWLYILSKTKVKYFEKPTAVYRVLENSACHSDDLTKKVQFLDSIWDVKSFYCNFYNFPLPERNFEREYYDLIVNSLKVYGYNKNKLLMLKKYYKQLNIVNKRDKINYFIVSNKFLLFLYRLFF